MSRMSLQRFVLQVHCDFFLPFFLFSLLRETCKALCCFEFWVSPEITMAVSFINWKRVYSSLIGKFCFFLFLCFAPAENNCPQSCHWFHCTSCFPSILPNVFGTTDVKLERWVSSAQHSDVELHNQVECKMKPFVILTSVFIHKEADTCFSKSHFFSYHQTDSDWIFWLH